jgi:hypothetical protein
MCRGNFVGVRGKKTVNLAHEIGISGSSVVLKFSEMEDASMVVRVHVSRLFWPVKMWLPSPTRIPVYTLTQCLVCALLFLVGPTALRAQDIEPRILTPAPVGTNIVGLTFAHSGGAVLLDKTLPVENVDGSTFSLVPSYTRFFNFFGLSSQVSAAIPLATGEWEGQVLETTKNLTVERTGFGDGNVGWTVFLAGAPAMTKAEFRNYERKTTVGVVCRVSLPTGEYDSNRLINLGSNRWHVAPALGVSHWIGKLAVEGYAAAWIFTDNTSMLGDNVLSQDPLFAFQAHLTYAFKPRLWLALGARRTTGGRTSINGVEQDETSENARMGLVLGFPISDRLTAKIFGTTGVRSSTGNDFNTLNVQVFYAW